MKYNNRKQILPILILFGLFCVISGVRVESLSQTNVEERVRAKIQAKVLTNNKIKTDAKDKRTATEFFTELFSENTNLGDFLGGTQKSPDAPACGAPGAPVAPGVTGVPPPSGAPVPSTSIPALNSLNNIISNSTTTSVSNSTIPTSSMILMDWLMISSPVFKNSLKFPPVLLNSGVSLEIKVDSLFFRLNDGFRPGVIGDLTLPATNKYFWFRLSGSNLYYSSTTTDINILGAIAVRYIVSVDTVPLGTKDACFIVRDLDNQDWKICASTIEIRTKWVSKLQSILGVDQDSMFKPIEHDMDVNGNKIIQPIQDSMFKPIEHDMDVNGNKIIQPIQNSMFKPTEQDMNVNGNKTIIQPIIIIPLPSPHCNEDWNYQENGRDWQCDCSEGREQAPLDLPPKDKAIDSPIRPMFEYEEVSVESQISSLEGQLREKGNIKLQYVQNTLKILHSNFGKVITLDGAIYYAQEIVIHCPAEHKIDGKSYDLEVQIIHYGQTKGDIAKQVILSFLFERKAGVYNKFFEDLDIFNLPNPISKQTDLLSNIFIPKILYSTDNQEMPMMKPFSFYTYQGSITSPPCTEKTIMYVASKPLFIGTTALQLFQEALRVPDSMNHRGEVIVSDWIPISNREIQPRNGRPIFHYNHESNCGFDSIRPSQNDSGHYEKIIQSMTKYFYVNDLKPSGISGALVVSENEALGKDIIKADEDHK